MAGLNWTGAQLPLARWPTTPEVDLSPLNRGIQTFVQGQKEAADLATRQQAGQALAQGDPTRAANSLYQAGMLDAGNEVQTNAANQKRQAGQDQALLVKRLGGLAQIGAGETDPNRQSAILNRIYALDPKIKDAAAKDGADLSNPQSAFKYFMNEAAGYNGYQDPTDVEAKTLANQKDKASIGLIQAQTQAAVKKGDNSYAERAAAARGYGLDPNSDAGRAYVLTGKLPREDQGPLTATDKKAILEADDKVATNQNAINALGEAKKISPDAYDGVTARPRAWLGNNLPDWLVPDVVANPQASAATSNLDNAVVGSALTQLKAIFGGNPTEGERKVLLDLQGSASQPQQVRDQILERAKVLANARLNMNMREAEQLRGGSFYKPGGGMTGGVAAPAGAVTGPGNPSSAEETKMLNGKTYVKINGQWYEQ